jgi:hypothetical protein
MLVNFGGLLAPPGTRSFPVIAGAFIRICQNAMGLIDLLKPCSRFWTTFILVGMIFHRQFAIGSFDFFRTTASFYAENRIEILVWKFELNGRFTTRFRSALLIVVAVRKTKPARTLKKESSERTTRKKLVAGIKKTAEETVYGRPTRIRAGAARGTPLIASGGKPGGPAGNKIEEPSTERKPGI